MSIALSSEDLSRILSNTMKFVNPKSIWVNNLLVVLTTYDITCYACDGYFALADRAFLINGSFDDQNKEKQKVFALSLDDAKDLEKFARENKKTDITITFSDVSSGIEFGVNDTSFVAYTPEEVNENWDMVDYLLYEDLPETSVSRVEFSPERFTKLSQLKHDKDIPMACKFIIDEDDRVYLRFKIGLTIRGFIASLRSEVLDPDHLWEGNE